MRGPERHHSTLNSEAAISHNLSDASEQIGIPDVLIGLGTATGVILATTGFIESADRQVTSGAMKFFSRAGVALVASASGTLSSYLSSHLRRSGRGESKLPSQKEDS